MGLERDVRRSWITPRRLFLILPAFLFAIGLTAFQAFPEERHLLAWVCSSCARVREELRVSRLGVPMHWTYDVSDSSITYRLDPHDRCRHEWKFYWGIGGSRLAPYERPAVQQFVADLADRGFDVRELLRWDLRGDIEGAWTRGPFPVLKDEPAFKSWFQTVRASDPKR